ncbi:MAG: restriction endonuclease [Gammaproteobacteria bacterium]|nr:MAG: restriction endonuclease [Gammaproteobacteria bacterium]
MKPNLTLEVLKAEAREFAQIESQHHEPTLYGITDGKAVGTYFEHKFRLYLRERYEFMEGSSARGIDFPELGVDMKVTSIRQPQSSCPFRSARQKIYGLGYSLLVFVYEKTDDPEKSTGNLRILHTIFIDKEGTADFQTTVGLRHILENQGNKDDILAFFEERRLPVEEIGASALADEILVSPPKIGYLTISNALQWRLQYRRVIEKAGLVPGIERLQ